MISKWHHSELNVKSKWIQSDLEVKSKSNRSYTEVKWKWNRREIDVKSKWNRSEIEVTSKWTRSDIEVKPKWNRSDTEVKSNRDAPSPQSSYPTLVGFIGKYWFASSLVDNSGPWPRSLPQFSLAQRQMRRFCAKVLFGVICVNNIDFICRVLVCVFGDIFVFNTHFSDVKEFYRNFQNLGRVPSIP